MSNNIETDEPIILDNDIKRHFWKIPLLFKKKMDKEIEEGIIPTGRFGWEIRDKENVYQIEFNIRRFKKHD